MEVDSIPSAPIEDGERAVEEDSKKGAVAAPHVHADAVDSHNRAEVADTLPNPMAAVDNIQGVVAAEGEQTVTSAGDVAAQQEVFSHLPPFASPHVVR